jgi:hypothetical protein
VGVCRATLYNWIGAKKLRQLLQSVRLRGPAFDQLSARAAKAKKNTATMHYQSDEGGETGDAEAA